MSEAAALDAPPVRGAWRATAILFLAILLCYADQGLPLLLLDEIKAAFGLTDTQVAVLTGFSFAVSVSVFALPLSWVADRFDRTLLVSAGIALWCLATVGCGFANGFWALFLMRMGVGLGEAALKPTGYSLVADLFPPARLGRPAAILAFGAMAGGVVALSGVGAAHAWLEGAIARGAIPLAPSDIWRAILVGFGSVGLLVAVVALLWLPEPRRARWKGRPEGAPAPGLAGAPAAGMSLTGYLRASAFFYVPFTLSMTTWVLYNAGFSGWLGPFFLRTYGWSIVQTGQVLGALNLIAGLLGLPLGLWANEALQRRLKRPSPVTTMWIALAVVTPAVVLTSLAPNGWWAVAGLFVMQLPLSAATVVTPIVFTSTAPPHLRARMVAVCSLVFGIGGSAIGPVLYGAFTDYVLRDPAKLFVTLSVLPAALTLLFLPLLILADRRYVAAVRLAAATAA